MSNKNQVTQISINKLEKFVDYRKSEPVIISFPISETESIDVVIKQNISYEDKVKFINDVVTGVFNNENYQPYFKEELFNIAILEYFTNVKIDTKAEFLIALVTQTNLCENIRFSIGGDILSDLKSAIDDMIEYRKQEILSSEKQKLQDAVDEIIKYVETFAKLGEQFKDIDPNSMLDIFKKIADKDEHSLAKATLDVMNENDNSDKEVQLEGQTSFEIVK